MFCITNFTRPLLSMHSTVHAKKILYSMYENPMLISLSLEMFRPNRLLAYAGSTCVIERVKNMIESRKVYTSSVKPGGMFL